jgi:dihydrofolate reductase
VRLVVTEFMSLDGVVESPAWTFPYWTDDTAAFKQEETERSTALLLGRRTYEEFAKAWPGRSAAEGGDFFNPVRKHVVTSTLTKDIWQNATFLAADRKAIERLKAQPGGDLTVHGSITLARWLLGEGLVDELRLLVYPVVVGKGKRLFDDTAAPAKLRLAQARPLQKGVVALVYTPEGGHKEAEQD